MKFFFYALLISVISSVPAFAGVDVTSPTNGEYVGTTFLLSASSPSCSSQSVSAMGYSLDNSTSTSIFGGTSSIQANITTSAGTHTLHVKSWGAQGAACVTDVQVTVTTAAVQSVSTSSSIAVSTPSSGQNVSSPFPLTASATSCDSAPVSAMGYSLDGSSTTTIFQGSTNVQANISASAGTHTLHVKSWNTHGAGCTADIPINVTQVNDNVAANTNVVPSNAVSVSNIEILGGWAGVNDSAVNGSSSGSTWLVNSPSYSGAARAFATSYSNNGAQRYSVKFGDDTTSTNFFYDGWVYTTGSVGKVANLELDINQTMANGQTVIFGFQCDGYSSTWDYAINAGTAQNPQDKWINSNAYCNVRNWSQNTWHHVQISYSRNTTGWITYKTVWLDGVAENINVTAYAAQNLGWDGSLSTNFQVDGLGSGGSSTLYLDSLTIYRW